MIAYKIKYIQKRLENIYIKRLRNKEMESLMMILITIWEDSIKIWPIFLMTHLGEQNK